jgi:putative membrane protein
MRWLRFTGLAFVAFHPAVAAGRGNAGELPWNWDPWILLALVFAFALYVCGLLRMRRDANWRVVGPARVLSFASGIAVLFLVLITPFGALDDDLFSAHMLQHLVLMMVAPPLLVSGRPSITWLWAFPLRTRRAIGRLWFTIGFSRIAHFKVYPVIIWLVCGGALWFWHLPGPFRWALKSEIVHAIEHACFFIPALLFWALVFQRPGHRSMDYGTTIFFVAAAGVQNGLLGAILTFATHPLYTIYAGTTAAWGLTPLEDQQIAGLLMWIPAGLIHLATLAFLFVAWMHMAELRAILEARPAWNSAAGKSVCSVLVLAASLILNGCDHFAEPAAWQMRDADAARGLHLMQGYGCGSCHTIPGVPKADGGVGPPLTGVGRRTYIAGVLLNTPDNMVRWLRNPQTIVPGNAMPDMDIAPQDARDLAAYLYSLPEH